MKKIFFLVLATALVVTACNSFGDKVEINSKSEVFYKGNGVTAADAKKLGEYLLKNHYFDTISNKSVQLTKVADTFNVKFVVDKAKVEQQGTALFLFQVMAMSISSDVFNNKPVKVELADAYMKTFKDIPTYGTSPSVADTTHHSADTTQAPK